MFCFDLINYFLILTKTISYVLSLLYSNEEYLQPACFNLLTNSQIQIAHKFSNSNG